MVPQGSVLGPLLFLIVMDTITRVKLSPTADLRLYADDICYFRPISTSDDCIFVQSDVDQIELWGDDRDLKFNATKTKCMMITRMKRPPTLCLEIGGSPIKQVYSFCYIGILLSSDLSWSAHIASVCGQAKQKLGLFYFQFRMASTDAITKLYIAVVVPSLTYGASV